MSIEFATIKSWEIPEGIITQITDASGRVLWSAIQKVKVTITSEWLGMNGDTASITVNSSMPFTPDPSNPSYKTKTWTVSVADEPNCTIEIPVGSTIECTVSRDKGNADSYIKLNGSKVVTGDGTYIYTVTRDVTVTVADEYSQGDYGMITIVETGAVIATPVTLEVAKITSNTYAAETTYENESFILLDVYPKKNGTVSITYGGLTKTITDTSGVEKPNAQQVFFGTFNGVSDSVVTPTSGELIIEGDYYAFGIGSFANTKYATAYCTCINEIVSFGDITEIGLLAFYKCNNLTSVTIPSSVTTIGGDAFAECDNLVSVTIPSGVTTIENGAFELCDNLTSVTIPSSVTTLDNNPFRGCPKLSNIHIDENNPEFLFENGCIFNKNKTILYSCPNAIGDYIIPSGITTIEPWAFAFCDNLTSVTIPSSVTTLGGRAFSDIATADNACTFIFLSETPPVSSTPDIVITYWFSYSMSAISENLSIIVPKGCGEIYKAANGWATYADYITEAS